jgi:hypothetical protein
MPSALLCPARFCTPDVVGGVIILPPCRTWCNIIINNCNIIPGSSMHLAIVIICAMVVELHN